MNNSKSRWKSVLLSIITPGLGQVFNGELLKGSCMVIFFTLFPLIVAWMTVRLPDVFLLPGVILALLLAVAVYLYAVFDAFRTERKEELLKSSYQSGFFYLAFWLVSMVFMLTIQNYIRTNIVEAYKIVTESMSPHVLKGDYVLVDKTAYHKEPVNRGEIIIHVFPDDRSKVFIRQVVALPNDELSLAAGTRVAHGTILVKGYAKSGKILDSDSFGPIDMRDIVGKVKQIYFSKGAEGIRWQRIGQLMSHEPQQ